MILMPVLGRTRSSLVAGIFEASGAWVGSSTVSMINRYDTFENWRVILHLQKKFGLRARMEKLEAEKEAPAFREFVETVVPHDRVVCLKFVWYYDLLFRCAFPDSDFYFVSRSNFPIKNRAVKKRAFNYYKLHMRNGTWIDTEKLVKHDFSEIRPIIDQYSALQWNQQGVDALYRSNGAAKYEHMKKVNR